MEDADLNSLRPRYPTGLPGEGGGGPFCVYRQQQKDGGGGGGGISMLRC